MDDEQSGNRTVQKINLWGLTLGEMQLFLKGSGVPGYRAEQVYSWLYGKAITRYEEMKNLPRDLLERLSEETSINLPQLEEIQEDQETRKALFRLEDGHLVEAVRIEGKGGGTFCLSTQVGCDLSCGFCASGKLAFERNLTTSEIVGQVMELLRRYERPSNLVYMGMGEPFLNYEAVMHSLRIVQEEKGLNFGARRITVSTAGVAPEIYRFAREAGQVNLAVSLHATTDRKRARLMPLGRVYNLRQLLDACWVYVEVTGRRISFEYVVLKGFNDSHHDADRLVEMLHGRLAHLNLIACNPVRGSSFQRPSASQLKGFADYLAGKGLNVTIRRSPGRSLEAACGQLAGRRKEVTRSE